jgi:glycosyltransferase involved in cell wall biosynthesis
VTKTKITQILVGASSRDAITTMALSLRNVLRSNYDSEIFSFFEPEQSARNFVQQLREIPNGSTDDYIVYHSSYGLPDLTFWLLSRPEKIIVQYHNITPSFYYAAFDPEFAEGLEWGRNELHVLSHKIIKFITDSEFNKRDLEEMGFNNIAVIPAGVNPHRLKNIDISPVLLTKLDENFPNGFLLFLSQVLPHKRAELAIETCFILNSIYSRKLGLVIAGAQRNSIYADALKMYVEKLGMNNVLFLGEVSERELATLYRSASIYLGTSDHEGLSIPPLEAMANGLVGVVRGRGAVPDTVGDGAIVLGGESGALEMAVAVNTLVSDPQVATRMRRAGRQRVDQIISNNSDLAFCELLSDLQS